MARNVNAPSDGSSPSVVAVAVRSLLERRLNPNNVKARLEEGLADTTTSTDTLGVAGNRVGAIVRSVSPVGLNAPATQRFVEALRAQSADAKAERDKPRPRQTIPTADLVKASSFKINSKLVIRIVPQVESSQKDAVSNELGEFAPQLSFDAFSLQSVAEADEERHQIHETFEGEVLYLFGRRPRIWTFQGIVLNGRRASQSDVGSEQPEEIIARDQDFANELLRRYDEFYRGTRAVELRARTYIAYDDVLVEGTLLSMVASRNAQIPAAVNVTFSVIVHARTFFGQIKTKFTDPDVADLIDKLKMFEDDKALPSTILPAQVTQDQLRALNNEAQEELLDAQNETDRLSAERDATAFALEEKQQEQAQAAADVALAAVAREVAQDQINSALAANDAVAAQQALKDRSAAETELNAASSDLDDAKAATQKLETQLSDLDAQVQAASDAEEDARQKAETVHQMTELTTEEFES